MRRWVELVVSGYYSDTKAYELAYRCKKETAASNATRLRSDAGVMQEVSRLQAMATERLGEVLTNKSKKGTLVSVMLDGTDSDKIRAIKELNAMEAREQALGGGEETEFSRLLMSIASRPRVLPKDDPDDCIDIDT